jgi:hypothetical protein
MQFEIAPDHGKSHNSFPYADGMDPDCPLKPGKFPAPFRSKSAETFTVGGFPSSPVTVFDDQTGQKEKKSQREKKII